MRRINAGSEVRKRMLRLKKRKSILRRQQSLREKILLVKQQFHNLSNRNLNPSFDTESVTKKNIESTAANDFSIQRKITDD